MPEGWAGTVKDLDEVHYEIELTEGDFLFTNDSHQPLIVFSLSVIELTTKDFDKHSRHDITLFSRTMIFHGKD